eukprot:scaffold278527_cov26-Tisochrysis_lutea.AAC.4
MGRPSTGRSWSSSSSRETSLSLAAVGPAAGQLTSGIPAAAGCSPTADGRASAPTPSNHILLSFISDRARSTARAKEAAGSADMRSESSEGSRTSSERESAAITPGPSTETWPLPTPACA